MRKIILTSLLCVSSMFALSVGEVPKTVSIDGKNGGLVSGGAWDSSAISGKVHVLFYVDPDKKDLNNAFADALKAKNFSRKKFNSVAIINLAATWLPNALIESKLADKQKKFPDTLYVKDKKSVLVNEWNLADDNSDILVFDKTGKLIYKKFGKVSDNEIQKIITLIEKNL